MVCQTWNVPRLWRQGSGRAAQQLHPHSEMSPAQPALPGAPTTATQRYLRSPVRGEMSLPVRGMNEHSSAGVPQSQLQWTSCHGSNWGSFWVRDLQGFSSSASNIPWRNEVGSGRGTWGRSSATSQKAVKKGEGRWEGTERQLMCELSLNWHPKSEKNLCCDLLRVGKKRILPPAKQVSQSDLLWICF